LTGIGSFSYSWLTVMKTRLTSLVLVLMLSGSAFAGVPWQFGEHACSMDHSMGGMACCKAALMEGQTPQASVARLCCALNCSKEGTPPTNGAKFSPQLQLTISSYPAIPQAVLDTQPQSRRFAPSHGPPSDSHPAYIRNLALLI
jgi:hypothetical protein